MNGVTTCPSMLATVSTVTMQCIFIMWRDECLHSVVTLCYEGYEDTIGDHTDEDAGVGYYVPMGSIMVLPGCTAYLFMEHNYEGERLKWIIDNLFYCKVICR